MQSTAIILAAGLGTRMRSSVPKALHSLGGRPMLRHLIASCEAVFDNIVVVTGPDMAAVAAAAQPHAAVVQADRLGTAHAALQAETLFGDGEVAVLYADNPLIRPDTLRRLVARRRAGDCGLALLAMQVAAPNRYGRVMLRDGYVERIVEFADASAAERAETLCNAGVLCAEAATFRRWLRAVGNANSKGEYYLTDVVAIAHADGARVAAVEAPETELRGVNSRAELAQAESVLQSWLREAALEAGVTMPMPDTVYLSADTQLAADVVVEPHVVFGPGVQVAEGAQIRAFSHLEGCQVAARAVVGPYARLRPGTVLETGAQIGNFVELKNARMGAGAKANHLTYLGDAAIGPGANIGAGTITANYDGYNKHRTEIGAGVFIGSNATLIAPLGIGDQAIVAAGSVITADVETDAIAFGRARQANKKGLATAFRASRKKETR